MALPLYTYDSIPTDTEFNAFLRPVFNRDELQEEFPGSLLRLRDDSLSNDPTQIKSRWQTFERALQAAAGSSLTVNYSGGAVTLPSGLIATIAPGSAVALNNAVSFLFVNSSGLIEIASSLPAICIALAQITAVGGAITQIQDLRPRFTVGPLTLAVKIFGGTGEQGDYTLSGSATFSDGDYYFRNFTINAGATLTISRAARLFISGFCTIAGSVVVTTATAGGAGGYVPGNTIAPIGRNTGGGIGGGSGNAGRTYNFVASSVGSGGGSGMVYPTTASNDVGAPSFGGDGGGGLLIESAGPLLVSGSITARGGNASLNNDIVSGNPTMAGGGGGSGGLISLKSLVSVTVTPAATLDVRGGNGSDGVGTAGGVACGGCGGGGGQVLLVAPLANSTGATILLTGGAGGVNRPGMPNLGGGAGGSFGGSGGNPFPTPFNNPGSSGLLTIRLFRAVG